MLALNWKSELIPVSIPLRSFIPHSSSSNLWPQPGTGGKESGSKSFESLFPDHTAADPFLHPYCSTAGMSNLIWRGDHFHLHFRRGKCNAHQANVQCSSRLHWSNHSRNFNHHGFNFHCTASDNSIYRSTTSEKMMGMVFTWGCRKKPAVGDEAPKWDANWDQFVFPV